MSDRIVIYHNNCYDGVTAALVCKWKFGDQAEYLPFNYSDSPPNVMGKDVVIVDFSFKREVTLKMKEEARSLLILDHHKTAEKELEGLDYAIFDMERSGAGLAWDYYFGTDERLERINYRPSLINYIEDRDLWRFRLPDSKLVNAWIQSWDIDLKTFEESVAPLISSRSLRSIAGEGESLLRQQDKLVKSIAANAKLTRLGYAYMGPYVVTSILMSEVCELMLKNFPDYPFSFYSFERLDGKIQVGLRSRANSDFDVSSIAKEYKGGGHKNAAGFELDKELAKNIIG